MQNGKYVVTEFVGKGGFSTIWRARNNRGEKVGIKIINDDYYEDERLRPFLDDVLFRFKHEAAIMSKLSHPGIPKYFGSIEYEGRPAIVMEWVKGTTIGSKASLNGGTLSGQECTVYWNKIVPILEYIHSQGVVHCDISPGNILVTPSGDIKLIDFGIADSPMNGKTGVYGDTIWGTAEFMSPEQVLSPQQVDYRTDYYSLARTFVYLLSGNSPRNNGWAKGENGLSDYCTAPDVVFRGDVCDCLENLEGCPYDWQDFLKPYLSKDPRWRPRLKKKGMDWPSWCLKPGTELWGGRYRIINVAGMKRNGIEYNAEQVSLNRIVSVVEFFMREYCVRNEMSGEVIPGSKEGDKDYFTIYRKGFIRNGQECAEHKEGVIDLFEDKGTAYFVMDPKKEWLLIDKMSQIKESPPTRQLLRGKCPHCGTCLAISAPSTVDKSKSLVCPNCKEKSTIAEYDFLPKS